MYPTERVFLTGLGSPFRVRVAPDATPALGNKWPYFLLLMLGVNLTRIRPNYYAQHRCHGVSLQMGRESISLRSQMPCGLRNHNRGHILSIHNTDEHISGQRLQPQSNQVKKRNTFTWRQQKDKCKYRCNSSKPMGTWCQYSSSFICFKLILK